VGSNTREVVFGLVGITILAVAVWVMFNQADPSEKDDPAPASTEASETISKLPTRVPGISNRDETSSPSQTPGPTPISTNIPDFHLVQEGETLTTIAAIYGANADDIAAKNKIVNPNTILAGQRLLLPAVGEELPNLQSGPIDPKTYIVKEGDTLYGLSQEFGVSVEALMEANSIEDQNRLFIGLRLQIPDQVIPQP
jgi:LysM repeat protein